MSQSQQPNLIALCAAAVSLPTVAVLLRLWGGYIQQDRKFGWDDTFAVATLPFIWAENALIFWWISIGLGTHASTVSERDLAQGPKIIFAAAFLYDAAITFPKFSVLFFYHRIFKVIPWTNKVLWTIGSMNSAWLAAGWISTIFQCSPVEKAWNTALEGHCFTQWNWFLGTAITSMVIDLFILVMPLPILWGLEMSTRRKLVVTGVFICGYAVVVVSIGRLISLAKAGSGLEDDLTWNTIPYIEWVQCEGPISLISVSLPNIFYLVRSIYSSGFYSILTGRTYEDSSTNVTDRQGMLRRGSLNDKNMSRTTDQGTDLTKWRADASSSSGKCIRASDEPSIMQSTTPSCSRDNQIYVLTEVNVEST